MSTSEMLKVAVPNKGRLSDGALELLARAGFHVPRSARSLMAEVNGRWRLLFVRTQDVPEYVATGTADAGITGRDVIAEHGLPVETLLPLGFGRCRLVLAVPRLSGITSADELQGRRIATVFPTLTDRFFAERGLDVELVPLSGATELAPHVGVADAIVDLVETGSTLRQNGLVEVETILHSEAELIANAESLRAKRALFVELKGALASVLEARARRYLMVNLPLAQLEHVKTLLPGVTSPTVMNLLDREDWVAMHAVIGEDEVNRLIPELKRRGAQGLLVLPIERMVP